jgi:hypothetical protein
MILIKLARNIFIAFYFFADLNGRLYCHILRNKIKIPHEICPKADYFYMLISTITIQKKYAVFGQNIKNVYGLPSTLLLLLLQPGHLFL